jgi:hypothetical protein
MDVAKVANPNLHWPYVSLWVLDVAVGVPIVETAKGYSDADGDVIAWTIDSLAKCSKMRRYEAYRLFESSLHMVYTASLAGEVVGCCEG